MMYNTVDRLLKFTGMEKRGRRNCCDYRLVNNDVTLQNLPAPFEGYTILHLSDLHVDGLLDDGEDIRQIIEAVPCDLAVVTGDFSFDADDVQFGPFREALAPILHAVGARDGIFGILGDFDSIKIVPELERMGVTTLLNESTRLQRGGAEIVLAGVDDPHFYRSDDLREALAGVVKEQFTILLSHSPEIVPAASRSGVNLYLCGHTHGGQICLPGGIALAADSSCDPRYLSGSWKCGAMQGYTSRGVGFSGTAARFFCPPEITLHTLHSGGAQSDFFDTVQNHVARIFGVTGHAAYA